MGLSVPVTQAATGHHYVLPTNQTGNSDKEQKTIVMIDVVILVDTNIRKKQKTEVARAEGATGANVESRVQSGSSDDSFQQIPGTTSEVSVQKTPSLRTARIL